MIGRLLQGCATGSGLRRTVLSRGMLVSKYHGHRMSYDDVVRLKQTEKGTLYTMINGNTLIFPGDVLLQDLKLSIMQGNDIFKINILSKEGLPFHDTTPLKFITEDSFSIVINETDKYYVMKFEDEDILDNYSMRIRDGMLQDILVSFGSSDSKRGILCPLVNQIVDDILKQKNSQGKISGYNVRKIIENKIMMDSIDIKNELATVEQLIVVLENKKQLLTTIREEAERKIEVKSKRRLKMLYSLILAQMAFTQYGTYVKYSWDIMEPITLLFGILDGILAYSYWMTRNMDYDLEAFEKAYIDRRVNKYFGDKFNLNEEIEDIVKMINHLTLWKSLHSNSLPHILEALDDKFHTV